MFIRKIWVIFNFFQKRGCFTVETTSLLIISITNNQWFFSNEFTSGEFRHRYHHKTDISSMDNQGQP